MAAAKYNIAIEQGATFKKEIVFKDSVGVPRDLSNYIARGMIRKNYDDALPIIEFDCTPDPTALGVVTFGLSAADTATLDFTTALYDIEIEQVGSSPIVVERVLQGNVVLSKEVTK